jgi:catechol 2,3-dioxygenase-like lactoylglutathione lyase family enzyme
MNRGVTSGLFSVTWWLFFFAAAGFAQEPAQFHHYHLNVIEPASSMEYFSSQHGAVKVILQGFGVGARTDKSYVLFERSEEDAPVQTWPPPDPPGAWSCKDADRCFEDARSRLEFYPPNTGLIARMEVLSHDPNTSRLWFEKHLGVRAGDGKTPLTFVFTKAPLATGNVIDHIAFSYPSIADVLTRLQAEGVKIIQKLPKSVMVEGPEGMHVEIAEDSEIGADAYWCPMDPTVRSSKPGKCPRCGMQLVPLDPGEYILYPMDMKTVPNPAVAGRPFKLVFSFHNPHTDAVVKNYETVHTKLFHLFVVSHDFTFFEHIHPVLQPDGSFVVETTVPKPGPYQTFSDFFPSGGSPQVVQRTFVTAGYTGSLLAARAHLTPDPQPEKIVDGTRVRLDATGYTAEFKQTLTFTLTDEATGKPVKDLEQYLGAWAHMLMLSEDLGDYVHAHATVDQNRNGETQLNLDLIFPRASNYRLWIQFQRSGRVITVPFTLKAKRLG